MTKPIDKEPQVGILFGPEGKAEGDSPLYPHTSIPEVPREEVSREKDLIFSRGPKGLTNSGEFYPGRVYPLDPENVPPGTQLGSNNSHQITGPGEKLVPKTQPSNDPAGKK